MYLHSCCEATVGLPVMRENDVKHTLKVMFAIVLSIALPSVAHAKTKVCNSKGECSIGHWARCSDILIPSTWTCTVLSIVRPEAGDKVVRGTGGRASLVVSGQTMPIISDELTTRWSRKKPTAKEFESGLANDKGAVSEKTLRELGTELGLRIPR